MSAAPSPLHAAIKSPRPLHRASSRRRRGRPVARRKARPAAGDMAAAATAALAVALAVTMVALESKTEDVWVPSLHRACLRCLCEAATGCNARFGCVKGYCGPFKISRLYWMEAGNITLPNDDPERAGAYEDCARQYMCSARLVTSYMAKLKKDCNGDGLVNCDDFALMHFNGGYSCEQPLNQSEAGQLYAARYHRCRPEDNDPDPLGRTFLS